MKKNKNMPDQHSIKLNDAKTLTSRYRDSVSDETIRAFKFERSAITELFAQDDVAGLRVYLGREPDGSLQAVLVATNSEGRDITDVVMNHASRCPANCDQNSGL